MITDIFKNSGYQGVHWPNQSVTFEPKNIRSVNAAFDPKHSGSANLLKGLGALGIGTGLYGEADRAQ